MRSPVLFNPVKSIFRDTPSTVWISRLAWLLLGFGVVIRTIQYGANRALWADEAKLALNLVDRSYGELLQPLDYDQIAPVGFLWAEKGIVQLFGQTEYALRLVPFVAGLASLILFYRLASSILSLSGWNGSGKPSAAPIHSAQSVELGVPPESVGSDATADAFVKVHKTERSPTAFGSLYLSPIALPIALLLFVCSSDLVYYASEVKQYSSDVAIALLLSLVLLEVRRPVLSQKQVAIASVVGAIALWCSHPAVFVLTGIELTYLVSALRPRRKNRRFHPHDSKKIQWGKRFIMYGAWSLSFAAFYGVTILNHPAEGTLTTSWDYTFPESWTDLDWLFYALKRFFRNPLRFPDGIDEVAIALFLLGCFALARRTSGRLCFLLAPIGVTLVASYLQRYPFRDRLVLFLVPYFMLLLAVGAAYGWDLWRPPRSGFETSSELDQKEGGSIFQYVHRASSVIFIGLWLSVPLWSGSQFLVSPSQFEDIRPLMAYVQSHRQSGDRLYVFQKSQYQFEYYASAYGFQSGDYVISADPDRVAEQDFSAAKKAAYRRDLKQFRGERVWLLVADTSMRDDTEFLLSQFDALGQQQDQLTTPYPASFVSLYDLT